MEWIDRTMEHSFADRIEPDIVRGKMDAPDTEERAQLEGWLASGVPDPDTPARRPCDQQDRQNI